MADWSIFRSLLIGSAGMGATLVLFWLTAPAAGSPCRWSS